jgi:hypothetical protein
MKAKILSVRVERLVDMDFDLSYLGTYKNRAETKWAVDREKRGDMNRGEYRYWNPCNHVPPGDVKSWEKVSDGEVDRAIRETGVVFKLNKDDLLRADAIRLLDLQYIEQDYARCEAYNCGHWCALGIVAKAEVRFTPRGPIQTLRSGGLWGVESDSDSDYLVQVEQEELDDLRSQLEAVGFGKRAIEYAFRKVERREN